jgi:predicted ester cyclase
MSCESMVKAAIDVIWNDADLDRIPDFYSDDFVSHQPPLGIRWEPGHEGLRRLITATTRQFPDYHETIEDCVVSGDRVFLRLTNRGTDTGGTRSAAPTGRSFEVGDSMLVRIEGGKIAEQWGLVDLSSMYVRLGRIQPVATATRRGTNVTACGEVVGRWSFQPGRPA